MAQNVYKPVQFYAGKNIEQTLELLAKEHPRLKRDLEKQGSVGNLAKSIFNKYLEAVGISPEMLKMTEVCGDAQIASLVLANKNKELVTEQTI